MESEFSQESQKQAYEAVVSNDLTLMETLLVNVLANQEPQRSQAFQVLLCSKKHFPDLLFNKLFFLLRQSTSVNTRANAAQVLRFLQVRDLWPTLTATGKSNFKTCFIELLLRENLMPVVRLECRLVADVLCEILKARDQWPELVDFVLTYGVQQRNEKLQEAILLIFSHFPKDYRGLICETFGLLTEILCKILQGGLTSKNLEIKAAGLAAFFCFTHLLSKPAEHDKFLKLLHAAIDAVVQLLSESKEDDAEKFMGEFMLSLRENSQLFKPYVNNLLMHLVQIVEAQELAFEIKLFAVKFIIRLLDTKDLETTLMGLDTTDITRLFSVSMSMLLCIDDDISWYIIGNEEGENAGKTELYNQGIECLKRISIIYRTQIVPVAFKWLTPYMDSMEWQNRHAVITMLGEISKECSDEMIMTKENYLEETVNMIINSFQDPHFRVRSAAFGFMQLSTDLVQVSQILHHPRILPRLSDAFDRNKHPRLKEQVAAAFLSLANNLSPDCLAQYMNLNNIMSKLLIMLLDNDETSTAKWSALSSLNILTQSCREVASKHYGNYVSILLKLCNNQNAQIKQEAIRGIRVCAEFGGTDFRPFINEAVSKISEIIENSNRSQGEDVRAFDIAVCALGKICESHRTNIDVSKLLSKWLSLLPLTSDVHESKIVHQQLCHMVERLDEKLLGSNNEHLPKVIWVLLEVIRQGKGASIKWMRNLVKQIWGRLSHEAAFVIFSSLNPQHQKLLTSL